jgi:ACS family glucarate transporter-like MFS transporter
MAETPNPYESQPKIPDELPGGATRVRWIVFALSCTTSWMLYLHRYTFALIKPELSKQWGLGTDELGELDFAFAVCYTGFQIPLGILGDVVGVRLVLTGLILVWCFGLALHAYAPSSGVMMAARATLGIGQSAVFASLTRVTRMWFPTATRSIAQGFVGVFAGRFGGLCSNLLFATVLLGIFELDWRTAIYWFAGLGAIQAIAFWFLFRNSPREHPLANDAEASLIAGNASGKVKPDKMSQRDMLSKMTPRSIANLLTLNVQSILSTIADSMYSNWIPLFLVQVHALKFKEMGFYSALPLLGGAIGGAVGGWLNDFFIARTGNRRWVRSLVAFTGKGLAAVFLLIALLTTYGNPYVFCVMLFFVKLFGDWSLTTSWGTITDIGGKASASVFAFNNSVAGIGSMFTPLVFGYIVDYYNNDWTIMFKIACGTYALCALSWLFVNCTIPILPDEDE